MAVDICTYTAEAGQHLTSFAYIPSSLSCRGSCNIDSAQSTFRITMRFSSVVRLASVMAMAFAFPAYVDLEVRQTWQVRPWTAPGPTDGKRAHKIIWITFASSTHPLQHVDLALA
jgi:hypothetical protein